MGIYSLNICGPVVLPEAIEVALLLSHHEAISKCRCSSGHLQKGSPLSCLLKKKCPSDWSTNASGLYCDSGSLGFIKKLSVWDSDNFQNVSREHELFKGASNPDDYYIKLPTVTKIFFVFWLQKNALLCWRDPISLCCNSLSFVLSKRTARTVKLSGEKAATYPRTSFL